MPSISPSGSRIRTNVQGKQAYDFLTKASKEVAQSQLRLSTGIKINQASDDVSGYITSNNLNNRYSSLNTAMVAVEEARSISNIVQDSLDNIFELVKQIRESSILASSESTSANEKVALAKSSFRLAQQIDTVHNSTVFSGNQLLYGEFSAEWVVGFDAENNVKTIELDLSSTNTDFNINSNNFLLDISKRDDLDTSFFAGITGLDLATLDTINSNDLGVFSDDSINSFINNLSQALKNISKVNGYVGGIGRRLEAQTESIFAQNVNYKAAISRLKDSDVAIEQLNLTKNQFLKQSSLLSISQSNVNIINYYRLLN